MSTTETTRITASAPRKKRRVFLWIFLAIQVLFIIWIITGSTSSGPDTGAQAAQLCADHAWYPLYSSQADCLKSGGGLLAGASDVGKGLAVGLIIVFWMVVDVILGVCYGVYKLAARRSPAMTEDTRPEAPAIPGVTRWRIIEALGAVYGRSPRYNPETGRYDREPTPDEIADSPMWVRFTDGDGGVGLRGATIAEVADALAATYEPAGEPLSDTQCDRLDQLTTEWGKAVGAVREALEYASRPFPAPGAVIAAAWDGLGMLEGSEEEQASG